MVISHAPDGAIIYTVRQTAPNTSDEKYQGMYRLPLATSEGKLVLVAPPALPELTARLRPPASQTDPTPDYGAALPFTDLDGECFNAVLLVSLAPFEFSLRIDTCPPPEWCFTIDFTTTDGGVASVYGGTYSTGIGWVSEDFGGFQVAGLQLVLLEAANVATITIEGYNAGERGYLDPVRQESAIVLSYQSAQSDLQRRDLTPDANYSVTYHTAAELIDTIYFENSNDQGSPQSKITRLTLSGAGDNPFGEDDC